MRLSIRMNDTSSFYIVRTQSSPWPLLTSETALIVKLSRELFLKRFLPPNNALDDRSIEEYQRGSRIKPTVSGSAISLAGSGEETIVSTAHFFSKPSPDNTSESEFGAVV